MTLQFLKPLIATALAASLAATPAIAAEPPAGAKTVTVYLGTSLGKKMAAKDINEMHAKMEKDGWRFVDLEAQLENGDTEGVWLTYTRP